MHYYKLTTNNLYEDVAGELLDEIEANLYKDLPITFDSGLLGIGWGIDYLIEKGFIEGDSRVVNEEIDRKIMQIDPRRIADYSLETGFGGILYYVLAHMNMVFKQHNEIPFDHQYLHDMYTACTNIQLNQEIPMETQDLIKAYISFYNSKDMTYDNVWNISMFLQGVSKCNSKNISKCLLGINKGLAGMLFENLCLINS